MDWMDWIKLKGSLHFEALQKGQVTIPQARETSLSNHGLETLLLRLPWNHAKH